MSRLFKNPRQQRCQPGTPVTHGQPSAMGLVRGRQLGNGLRGYIPRQGPEGLQAVKGRLHHYHNVSLKCAFYIEIMVAWFYFEKFVTIT